LRPAYEALFSKLALSDIVFREFAKGTSERCDSLLAQPSRCKIAVLVASLQHRDHYSDDQRQHPEYQSQQSSVKEPQLLRAQAAGPALRVQLNGKLKGKATTKRPSQASDLRKSTNKLGHTQEARALVQANFQFKVKPQINRTSF